MKVLISISKGYGSMPVPGLSFTLNQEVGSSEWLETFAIIRQALTREVIQDLRRVADEGEALLDRVEKEAQIREEIAARLAEAS